MKIDQRDYIKTPITKEEIEKMIKEATIEMNKNIKKLKKIIESQEPLPKAGPSFKQWII